MAATPLLTPLLAPVSTAASVPHPPRTHQTSDKAFPDPFHLRPPPRRTPSPRSGISALPNLPKGMRACGFVCASIGHRTHPHPSSSIGRAMEIDAVAAEQSRNPLPTQCSLIELDIDALSNVISQLDVRSTCQVAASCCRLNAFVHQYKLAEKAFREGGVSFAFTGHRYYEDQSVYRFEGLNVIHALRSMSETIRGVITCRKVDQDSLSLDVQVDGLAPPLLERRLPCEDKEIRRIGVFKTKCFPLAIGNTVCILGYGHYLRLKVANGRGGKASYLLTARSRSVTLQSLKDFPTSMKRAYGVCRDMN